jgi:hypothetical protein
MTTRQRVLLAILGVAFVALLCIVAFSHHPAAKHTGSKSPGSSQATITPNEPSDTATPTVTPTAPPGTGTPPGGDDDPNVIGSGPTGQYKAAADKAVTAYISVRPGETSAQRAARLAPYFAAGSGYLSVLPVIANPQSLAAMKSSVAVSGTASASIVGKTAASYTLTVYESWVAQYTNAGAPTQTNTANGIFTVTMSTSFDGRLLTVIEPSYND